jgi:hypothetical protein
MRQFSGTLAKVALCGGALSCASAPRSELARPSQGETQRADVGTAQSDVYPKHAASGAIARACIAIPVSERGLCPVARSAVLGARELRVPLDPKGHSSGPAGAVVYMSAAPGLTVEWLSHLIECYQAQTAESGAATATSESCPLTGTEVSYSVEPSHSGFAVSIRSPHWAAAHHIYELSERWAANDPPASRVAQ